MTGIVGIGIATMDIYCHQKRMYPGGNEYNIAYNAKLQGARSGFMGVFADDIVGNILERTLVDAGVDTSHSHHEKGSSGYALVDLKDGDRIFLDWNKQGVTDLYPFTFTEEEIEYIKNVEDKIDEILGVTTNDKVEDIIAKPVEGETEVYAIIFSDGTMELRKEKPTETENVVFKTEESFSNKLFKNKK